MLNMNIEIVSINPEGFNRPFRSFRAFRLFYTNLTSLEGYTFKFYQGNNVVTWSY